jgi:hypothetical protein
MNEELFQRARREPEFRQEFCDMVLWKYRLDLRECHKIVYFISNRTANYMFITQTDNGWPANIYVSPLSFEDSRIDYVTFLNMLIGHEYYHIRKHAKDTPIINFLFGGTTLQEICAYRHQFKLQKRFPMTHQMFMFCRRNYINYLVHFIFYLSATLLMGFNAVYFWAKVWRFFL